MPPRGRPTLVVLSLVTSSSVASFSSASSCGAAACRSLVLAASFAFRRNSALLAAYLGPSSLSSSPRARTTLLTPTAIICRVSRTARAGAEFLLIKDGLAAGLDWARMEAEAVEDGASSAADTAVPKPLPDVVDRLHAKVTEMCEAYFTSIGAPPVAGAAAPSRKRGGRGSGAGRRDGGLLCSLDSSCS